MRGALLYFDESRFGAHSKLRRLWSRKGVLPLVRVRLGFKYFVYTAANPETGEHLTLQLPSVNTVYMNIFLHHLAEWAGGRKLIFVMDGAGWHKSKGLEVPSGVRLELLPP